MSNLYIMVGIPASGKSSYLDQFRNKDIVISRDDIRYSLMKEGDGYFDNEKQVYKEFIRQIQNAIDTVSWGQNIYVDATHINGISRYKLLTRLKLKKHINISCIYMFISLDKALKRNKNRKGLRKTPEDVIRKFYDLLVPPSLEEYNYKTIITINNDIERDGDD